MFPAERAKLASFSQKRRVRVAQCSSRPSHVSSTCLPTSSSSTSTLPVPARRPQRTRTHDGRVPDPRLIVILYLQEYLCIATRRTALCAAHTVRVCRLRPHHFTAPHALHRDGPQLPIQEAREAATAACAARQHPTSAVEDGPIITPYRCSCCLPLQNTAPPDHDPSPRP